MGKETYFNYKLGPFLLGLCSLSPKLAVENQCNSSSTNFSGSLQMVFRHLLESLAFWNADILIFSRLHHEAEVIQVVAKTYVLLLSSFSEETAEKVLEEIRLSVQFRAQPYAFDIEGDRQDQPTKVSHAAVLEGSGNELLAKFSLLVLDTAISGLASGDTRIGRIRTLLCSFLTPTGKLQVKCERPGNFKPR